MHSLPEFLLVAVVVVLTPGPGTAAVVRIAARDGRAAAQGTILGHSVGVLMWAVLSAVGVSALVLASQLAYDLLRIGGACFLVFLGVRSLVGRRRGTAEPVEEAELARLPERSALRAMAGGFRTGLVTGACNPKLAVFFVALFPQFLEPGAAVLPAALLMGVVLVTMDVLYFSTLVYLVHRVSLLLRPKAQRWMERVSGGVLVALGVRLAADSK